MVMKTKYQPLSESEIMYPAIDFIFMLYIISPIFSQIPVPDDGVCGPKQVVQSGIK